MDIRLSKILTRVKKPARYSGGEFNSIYKKRENGMLKIALLFPDVYEVGMSHLGSKILYGLYNSLDYALCERAYAPWPDMEQEMRKANLPLYCLESGEAVSSFDIIGFSLQYELLYTNILNMLDLSGIPLYSAERTGLSPLVIGGGPCTYNAECVADFFDLFVIGEGEEISLELFELYRKARRENWDKESFLKAAACIEGIYVPAFYDVEYKSDNTVLNISPKKGAPPKVGKRIVKDFDLAYYPEKFIVPSTEVVFDRAMVELFRGCIRGCRFCHAGYTYRPVRAKTPDRLLSQAKTLLESTGYEEISLSSLSSSDYKGLRPLCDGLLDFCEERKISLSLPSLRADNFSTELMERAQKVRKSGLTFAPEAGTQRLRDIINKNIREEDLLSACSVAFSGGWNSVKLYFMTGLPFETQEDLDGIADLSRKVLNVFYEFSSNRKRGVKITVSTSSYVPKAHTPFQWYAQQKIEQLKSNQEYLKTRLKIKNVTYNYHDAETSFIEAVFSRGDRRLSKVIETAWRKGCIFDGWDEYFNFGLWKEAFSECGIDPCFYANRERTYDEVLPWSHIDTGVSKEHLIRENENAKNILVSADCRNNCLNCGASDLLKGGVCDN